MRNNIEYGTLFRINRRLVLNLGTDIKLYRKRKVTIAAFMFRNI